MVNFLANMRKILWGTAYFGHKFQTLQYQHHTKQITASQGVDLHLTTFDTSWHTS